VSINKILIDYIEVSKSGNDCIDFSYGNYSIKNIKLEECGDKGISVGENSIVKTKEVNIIKSMTGIAAKDYSQFLALSTSISNVDTCVSAYNKKQEFSGGYINIKKFSCNRYNQIKFKDIQSEIFLKTDDI
jgi:hypothetical protein